MCWQQRTVLGLKEVMRNEIAAILVEMLDVMMNFNNSLQECVTVNKRLLSNFCFIMNFLFLQ